MKKILLFIVFIYSLSSASNIKMPLKQYIASGSVTDIIVADSMLYSSTDASCIDIFNLKTTKLIKTIKVSQIEDFMGDKVDAKIYSIDLIQDKLLILAQGKQGFRRVFIYSNNKLIPIIKEDKSLTISKAKFIDKQTILLGMLSNELVSFNITTKSYNWSVQVDGAKFSDFTLSEDKKIVTIADESGDLHSFDTNNGKLIKTFTGQNLDNVFQVDYKQGIIATAGQDRRVVIYNYRTKSAYYKSSNFLIYSVGLSPSGNIVAYSSDEDNNITLFNTHTKSILGKFGGNKMTLSNILFLNENEFLATSDDKTINFYKIK